MITDYRPWVTAVGNNDTNVYSFPFKITDASQIVVVQLDISVSPPTIDFVERGDVGLNVQDVTFDSVFQLVAKRRIMELVLRALCYF